MWTKDCFHAYRHSKSRFFCAVETLALKFCAKKNAKTKQKNHLICVKHEEKTVQEVKTHKLLVCVCKYKDFARFCVKKKIARSHDCETLTFRNSACREIFTWKRFGKVTVSQYYQSKKEYL